MLALCAAFILSVYNVTSGSKTIYFDSIAGVVFFLNLGRFAQKNYLEKALSKMNLKEDPSSEFLKSHTPSGVQYTHISKLRKGDKFFTNAKDVIPVGSTLTSFSAIVSYEQITGEPKPITIYRSSSVPSGSICISDKAEFQASEDGNESFVAQVKKITDEDQFLKPRRSSTIEKVSFSFAGLVVFFSLFTLWWFGENLSVGFERSVAMLLVACPCSFAVALPLAHAKVVQKGITSGIIFKSLASIEKLAHVKNFVFDKTGTLTCGHSSVTKSGIRLSNELPLLIRILTISDSSHHAVMALRKHFKLSPLQSDSGQTLVSDAGQKNHVSDKISNLKIEPGKGISGKVGKREFRLGSQKFTNQKDTAFNLFFTVDQQLAAKFLISDKLHEKTFQALKEIKKNCSDAKFYLLSGDSAANCHLTAKELELPPQHVFSEATPQEKLAKIKKMEGPLAMVGDGLNDTLAASGADVGISVGSGNNLLKRSSDVTLVSTHIGPTAQAIQLAKQFDRSVKNSYIFALFYNITGLALAFLGIINPLIAAVTMPINSAVVSLIPAYLIGRKVL